MKRRSDLWAKVEHVGGQRVLVPTTRSCVEWINHVNADRPVRIDPRQPRNGKHHRLYWCILAEVAHNTETYKDAEALHEAILHQLGMVEPKIIIKPDRTKIITWERESTAFRAMDQAAFSQFFERAMSIIESDMGFDIDEICKSTA